MSKFVTIKKAADMLGVSALTLRNWDKSGKFPATRHPINNYRVYDLKDVEDLLEKMSLKTGIKKDYSEQSDQKERGSRKLQIKHLEE